MPDTEAMIDDVQAAALIAEHGIVSLDEIHNACLCFRLGDGRKLTLWEGSREHGREWEIEDA